MMCFHFEITFRVVDRNTTLKKMNHFSLNKKVVPQHQEGTDNRKDL